jgi:hypothetical protein
MVHQYHHDYSVLEGRISNANEPPDIADNEHVVVEDFPTVGQSTHVVLRSYQHPAGGGANTSRQTIDTAPYLFIATAGAGLLLNVLLCCMVSWKRRNNRQIMLRKQSHLKSIEATLKVEPDDAHSNNLSDDDSDQDWVSLDYATDESEPSNDDDDDSGTLDAEEEKPAFEIVLINPFSRRRGHARIKHVMERLQVVYQSETDNVEVMGKSNKRLQNTWETLVDISQWDHDMKRLFQLGLPFVGQAAMEGGFEILPISVVGMFLGTKELSAYVVVRILVGTTGMIVRGLHDRWPRCATMPEHTTTLWWGTTYNSPLSFASCFRYPSASSGTC